MTARRGSAPHSRPLPPWLAVGAGLLVGAVAALVVLAVTRGWYGGGAGDAVPDRSAPRAVVTWRGAVGPGRSVLILPAGPAALGEPRLSGALFPGETPPRELVRIVLANRSEAASAGWSGHVGEASLVVDGAPLPLEPLPTAPPDPVAALRVNALGGGRAEFTVPPGSVAVRLAALPRGVDFGAVSGVKWGGHALDAERIGAQELDVARLVADQPPAVGAGTAPGTSPRDDGE